MKHTMGLYSEYFGQIKEGVKQIELRLNDEKRRQINVGDVIEFGKLPGKNELIQVEVTELTPYPNFRSIYEQVSFADLGCAGWTMDAMMKETYAIYSQQQEKEWGALAIGFKLVK